MAASDPLRDLPPDWDYGVTQDGRIFFISERYQETTWLHPITGQAVETGHQKLQGLPHGWEQDFTPDGAPYFIDHNNQQTSFIHPKTGRSASEEDCAVSPSVPINDVEKKSALGKGNTKNKQRIIKAPAAKRNLNARVVRKGLLYRLESRGISKTWKGRWCVLAEFALFIYKNNAEKNELSSILLPSYKVSQCIQEDGVTKEFAFKIEHENTKTELFHTDCQSDLGGWLHDLQMAATMRVGTGSHGLNRLEDSGKEPHTAHNDDRTTGHEIGLHHAERNLHPSQQSATTRVPQDISSAQWPWQSVPDLKGGIHDLQQGQKMEYDSHGSLRSLPQVLSKNHGFPSPNLRKISRNYPHQQPFDPAFDSPQERSPENSFHKDHTTNSQNDISTGPSRTSVHGTWVLREGYSHVQHLTDHMGMASDQGAYGDVVTHQKSGNGSHKNGEHFSGGMPDRHQNGSSLRDDMKNDFSSPNYDRKTSNSDGNYNRQTCNNDGSFNKQTIGSDGSSYGRDNRFRGIISNPINFRDFPLSEGGHFNPNTSYSEKSKYPKSYQHNSDHGRHQNSFQDAPGSASGSGHSGSSRNHRGNQDFERDCAPTHDSSLDNLNNLSWHRHPLSTHSPQHSGSSESQAHIYVNIPAMQSALHRGVDSQEPERGIYPLARQNASRLAPDVQSAVHHDKRNNFQNENHSAKDNQITNNSHNSCASNPSLPHRHRVTIPGPRGWGNRQGDSWHGQPYRSDHFADPPTSHFINDMGGVKNRQGRQSAEPQAEVEDDDCDARSMREAFERVQSFRQSTAYNDCKLQNLLTSSYKDLAKPKEGLSNTLPRRDTEQRNSDHFRAARVRHPGDMNQFSYSNNKIPSETALKQTDIVSVKPEFKAADRLSNADSGLIKEELEMSYNATLSPSGSYHHIDQDIDELYRRGSAFRPPSSTPGSVGGDSFFHSLPRSYKFKSIPDAVRGTGFEKQKEVVGNSENVDSDFDKNWEWYKETYLNPMKTGKNSQGQQQKSKNHHPRSISDLGFIHEKNEPLHTCQEMVEDFQNKSPPPKPLRASRYQDLKTQATQGNSHGRSCESQDSLNQSEPNLQSWPTQVLTARQLDVPTPSSLSSHPFFVPEDVPLPPPREQAENLTSGNAQDKAFRQDPEEGVYAKLKALNAMRRHPIQTVREDPNMPDSEVVETKAQKKHPLNGTRLRMSISAGDLIGKTHDELVLLLIQLRRNQAALSKAREFYRESINKRRPSEGEYHKQVQTCLDSVEPHLQEGHRNFVTIRSQLDEVEKKLEVYRPLINLVDNMVTMGSLYGGDNFMLATQYRKHLLHPDQYQPPREILEFSRQYQERRVVTGKQNYVNNLTAAETDLEDKIDRLNQLDRLLQEQSFKVSSFMEDKELLEKALTGIIRQLREGQESPREMNKLQYQLVSVEKELSRVTQDLAEASKALEEATAENNKTQHEVSLLRTKVRGELKRSKSAPSLVTENANTKMKMETELAQVQNMLQDLSLTGQKLSQQMSSIRRSSSGTQLVNAFDAAELSRKMGTYMETDLDSGNQMDLASQNPVQLPKSIRFSGAKNPLHMVGSLHDDGPSRSDLDGSSVHEKGHILTVRDVKRQSVQRRERKQDDGHQLAPLKDTNTLIHSRYPSYASSQSSIFDPSVHDSHFAAGPVYENLPPIAHMSATGQRGSAPDTIRTFPPLSSEPFSAYQNRSAPLCQTELALDSSENIGEFVQVDTTVVGTLLNSEWNNDPAVYGCDQNMVYNANRTLAQPSIETGHFQIQSTHPHEQGYSYIQEKLSNLGQSLASSNFPPQSVGRDASSMNDSPAFHKTVDTYPLTQSHYSQNRRPSINEGKLTGVYTALPWTAVPSGVRSGLFNTERSVKGRHMTMPIIPSRKTGDSSSDGDPISNARIDHVPDVVKSSLNNVDKLDQIDENTIDREILFCPQKVVIPERYDSEADAEHLTEVQKVERQEKADRIKRLLTNQSILSISQPDINHVPSGQLQNQLLQEKRERAHLLTLNQELARQVMQQSKKAAADRRKTWSGGQIAEIRTQYEVRQGYSARAV